MVVLFTDGQMDVGNKSEDRRLMVEARENLAPRMHALGADLYAVAFGDGADFQFLHELTQKAGGFTIKVQTPEELPKIFAQIFEMAKKPDMTPIEGGSITVDDSIDQLTVLIEGSLKPGQLALNAPNGKVFLSEAADAGINWLTQSRYTLISIDKPVPGLWQLKGSSEAQKAYVITHLSLKAQLASEKTSDAGRRIEAWLAMDGKRITDQRVLENATFFAEIGPLEKPAPPLGKLALHDDGKNGDAAPEDGVYTGLLSPLPAGAYQVRVGVDGKTFRRSLNLFTEVAPAPEGSWSTSSPPSEAPSENPPTPARPAIPAEKVPSPSSEAQQTVAEKSTGTSGETANVPSTSENPESVPWTQRAIAGKAAVKPYETEDIGRVLSLFGLINAAGLGVAALLFWGYRHFKQRGSKPTTREVSR